MTLWSRNSLFRSRTDGWLTVATRSSAAISAAVGFLVVGFLLIESWSALSTIGLSRFFSDSGWHPLSGQFNLLPMIVATALATMGALLLAGPLGVASAVFCQYYAPRAIGIGFRRLIELLAGIPSVVFGLWGLVVLVPLIANLGGSGQSLLAATLILGLMVLPTVALTSQAALQAVPGELMAGGAALGMERSALVWRIALPAARRGIGVGVLLAWSRAMGETMAVLMVAGNVAELPKSIVDPVRTMTANIALEMGDATSGHRSVLFLCGLILMGVVGLAVALAAIAGGGRDGKE